MISNPCKFLAERIEKGCLSLVKNSRVNKKKEIIDCFNKIILATELDIIQNLIQTLANRVAKYFFYFLSSRQNDNPVEESLIDLLTREMDEILGKIRNGVYGEVRVENTRNRTDRVILYRWVRFLIENKYVKHANDVTISLNNSKQIDQYAEQIYETDFDIAECRYGFRRAETPTVCANSIDRQKMLKLPVAELPKF